MKKIKLNKKQRNMMKVGATICFSLALILSLSLLFNNNKKNSDLIGTWYIGYKFYETDDLSGDSYGEQIQELHFLKDYSFFTAQKSTTDNLGGTVSGSYKIDGDKIILTFNQSNEVGKRTLFFNKKEKKLCLVEKCNIFYSDKFDNSFFAVKKPKE